MRHCLINPSAQAIRDLLLVIRYQTPYKKQSHPILANVVWTLHLSREDRMAYRATAVFALILFGATGQAQAEKVLRYSEDGAPTNLDPTQGSTVYTSLVQTALYDTLYEYKYLKVPYELKPNLATSLPEISKDNLTYTIKIKPGVKFINDPAFPGNKGREVTASDVVYSLKRHFDPKNNSQGSWLWQNRIVGLDAWGRSGADYTKKVDGITDLDKYTLQIKLIKPYPQLIYTLAMAPSAVVPKEAVDKYGKEFGTKAVGSGPFVLHSFNTKQMVMHRNPHFRQDIFDPIQEGYDEATHGFTGIKALKGKNMPIVDKVIVDFVNEPAARWASFTKGNEIQNSLVLLEQVDNVLASKTPPTLKPEYAAKYHLRGELEFGIVYTVFNMDDEHFGYSADAKQNVRNRALRCAIRKGFSWPERIKRFYNGIGEAYPGFIVPGIDGYDPTTDKESITYDVAGAKKMLAEHGWNAANLPVFEYSGVASVRNKQFFEQFRGWMLRIGYPKEKIKNIDFATFGDFSKAQKDKKLKTIAMGWNIDYPDSENLLQLFYGPNGSPGSNVSNYKNPAFDKLFEQSQAMQPSPERTTIYKQLNQMIIDDCVAISGFSRTALLIWNKNMIAYPTRNMVSNIFKYVDVK